MTKKPSFPPPCALEFLLGRSEHGRSDVAQPCRPLLREHQRKLKTEETDQQNAPQNERHSKARTRTSVQAPTTT